MSVLTRQFLQELGIELNDTDYQALAEHFDTTLHERVIKELVEELTPEQASRLAELKSSDDDMLQQWLIANVPDLSDIVSDEIDILLGEIAENTDALDQIS